MGNSITYMYLLIWNGYWSIPISVINTTSYYWPIWVTINVTNNYLLANSRYKQTTPTSISPSLRNSNPA